MNKKSHKKKQKKRNKQDGRNKENVIQDPEEQDVKESEPATNKLCYDVKHSDLMGRCVGCEWPLCSSKCPGLGKYTGHSTYECEALHAATPNYGKIEDLKDSYHALMPLRQKADPEKWAAIAAMEAHNELRKARGDIWPMNEKNVVRRLQKWGLQFDEEEIHTVCDPSELGTYVSAFRCPKCGGRVLSTAPLEPAAVWRCVDGRCEYSMPAGAAQAMLMRITDELEQIDANDVTGFEKFLVKYRNVLCSSHYLCLSALHSLSQLYGKVTSHMIHEMSEDQLLRKVEVCRDLMKVFDIIEPGYSRLRGKIFIIKIVGYLTEAALILGFEPHQSPEGLMATAARDALTKIKTWEQIIGKIS
ncbi:unnamed protein product [Leptidea sinapis]|uniref:MYND-type domain-containing protein n=1 Tax=Leptidea sinapis TaxID=189913 RepID=A0A5E4PWZ2_9NEOP|nr:unnamed protein product [Leptidea sinapis]